MQGIEREEGCSWANKFLLNDFIHLWQSGGIAMIGVFYCLVFVSLLIIISQFTGALEATPQY